MRERTATSGAPGRAVRRRSQFDAAAKVVRRRPARRYGQDKAVYATARVRLRRGGRGKVTLAPRT